MTFSITYRTGSLEIDLQAELKNSRHEVSGGGDGAEGARVGEGQVGGGEARMVEAVEALGAGLKQDLVVKRNVLHDGSVEIDVVRREEGVGASIAEGAGGRCLEGCGVEPVGAAGSMKIRRAGEVGTVLIDSGEGDVGSGERGKGQSAVCCNDGGNLPAVEEAVNEVAAFDAASGDDGDIEVVAEVFAAVAVVGKGVGGVLEGVAAKVADVGGAGEAV